MTEVFISKNFIENPLLRLHFQNLGLILKSSLIEFLKNVQCIKNCYFKLYIILYFFSIDKWSNLQN